MQLKICSLDSLKNTSAFELGIKKSERPAKEILILFFKHIGFLDDSNYFNLNPLEKKNLYKLAEQISIVVELGLSNYGFVDYTKYKPFPLVIYVFWRLKISNMGGPLESSNNSHLCEEKPVVVKVEPDQRSNGQNRPNSITGTSSIHTIVIPDDEDEHTIPYFKTPEPLGNPKYCQQNVATTEYPNPFEDNKVNFPDISYVIKLVGKFLKSFIPFATTSTLLNSQTFK